MTRYLPFQVLIRVALLAPLWLFSACSQNAARLEAKEENNPRYREGKRKLEQCDYDGAIKVFEALLRENPDMVRPHLDLGVLFDDRKKDYVRAIYHYQSYLERRPDTDKKKLLEQSINHAKISFVATFPMSPPAAREMEAAKSELEALRVQNRQLLEALRRHQVGGAGTPARPSVEAAHASGPPAGPGTGAQVQPARPASPDTYAVQSGDTLGKIAIKVYGESSKWNLIYEANKAAIPDKTRLKIGQPLTIPR